MPQLKRDSYPVSYYRELNRLETPQAEKMAETVIDIFEPKTVLDIGCATGLYIKPYSDRGVGAVGIDVSPEVLDANVMIPGANIHIMDAREPLNLGVYYDVVLCLEVLEHIEEPHADQAVANIVEAGKVLIVSPSPHGGGEHHHNPQPKDYWKEKFAKHGYHENVTKSKVIKDAMKTVMYTNWIDNIMVLEKLPNDGNN